ncbi:YkgJ family cysteine cluster protein [Planobispora siamensis]|uniref:YkgJ family cysteine cluster protein n=1 Tax=Planobispora siamensis TaxID=936338 RepID=UPI0023B222DB
MPEVACQGLCADSCRSPIDMSTLERERMRTTTGVRIPERAHWPAGAPCPALSAEGRCTGHAVRPTICRLWGAGANAAMRCPHGCTPEGGLLPDAQLIDLILTSLEIGGHRAFADVGDQIRALAADPALQPLLTRLISGDATAAPAIVAAIRGRRHDEPDPAAPQER